MKTEITYLLSRICTGPPGECWNWKGCARSQGYGQFYFNKRRENAHRAAYRLLVGPVPEGHILHHSCSNRACCNPSHLVLTTPSEHSLIDPGMTTAINRRKTHCKNGHELTAENTKVNKKEQRTCRTCLRLKARKGTGNKFKTHCKNGHPFDEENTSVSADGSRRTCRTCSREKTRQWKLKNDPLIGTRPIGRPKAVASYLL